MELLRALDACPEALRGQSEANDADQLFAAAHLLHGCGVDGLTGEQLQAVFR
jgi:hypothetical protein